VSTWSVCSGGKPGSVRQVRGKAVPRRIECSRQGSATPSNRDRAATAPPERGTRGGSGALRLHKSIAFFKASLRCPKGVKQSLGRRGRPRGLQTAFRRTVGRVIPWQVARQQSLPLFHPATAMYRKGARRARATAPRREVLVTTTGPGERRIAGGPNKVVHFKGERRSAAAIQGPTTRRRDTRLTADSFIVPEMRTFLLLPDKVAARRLTTEIAVVTISIYAPWWLSETQRGVP
jgi:hypothetical protein